MEHFPSNTHKQRAPEPDEPKKIERVVEGGALRRKKPLGRRFAETFGGGDARGVWSTVVLDVLIPAGKEMAADAVREAVERMLFGESRAVGRRTGHRATGSAGYTSYNRYANSGPSAFRREEPRERRPEPRTRTSSRDFDEIVVPERVQALEILDQMYAALDQYGTVSVADLCSMAGIPSNFTDNRWGWVNLQGSGVSHVRGGGYVLDLPKPEPID